MANGINKRHENDIIGGEERRNTRGSFFDTDLLSKHRQKQWYPGSETGQNGEFSNYRIFELRITAEKNAEDEKEAAELVAKSRHRQRSEIVRAQLLSEKSRPPDEGRNNQQ